MSGSYLGGTGEQRKKLESFKAARALAVTNSSLRETSRSSKNPTRESESERTPPTSVGISRSSGAKRLSAALLISVSLERMKASE
jgi:hypothetical protein